MRFNGTVRLGDLGARLQQICEGVEKNAEVWQVAINHDRAFVIGPRTICGRVFGLYDAEYGWPKELHVDRAFSVQDLVPGHRRHPVLVRGDREIAVAISMNEYRDILRLLGNA